MQYYVSRLSFLPRFSPSLPGVCFLFFLCFLTIFKIRIFLFIHYFYSTTFLPCFKGHVGPDIHHSNVMLCLLVFTPCLLFGLTAMICAWKLQVTQAIQIMHANTEAAAINNIKIIQHSIVEGMVRCPICKSKRKRVSASEWRRRLPTSATKPSIY